MKRTGPSNPELQELIQLLKKEQKPIWKRVAEDLEKPTRQRRIVNLSSINRSTTANDLIVVPGKVLGAGTLAHKLNIAAFSFSKQARTAIESAKGTCLSIPELIKKNPTGTNIKIIG